MQTYTGRRPSGWKEFETSEEMFEEAARLFNQGEIDGADFRLPDGMLRHVTKEQLVRAQEKENRNKQASPADVANVARATARRKAKRRKKNKIAKASRKANR